MLLRFNKFVRQFSKSTTLLKQTTVDGKVDDDKTHTKQPKPSVVNALKKKNSSSDYIFQENNSNSKSLLDTLDFMKKEKTSSSIKNLFEESISEKQALNQESLREKTASFSTHKTKAHFEKRFDTKKYGQERSAFTIENLKVKKCYLLKN